MSRRAVAAALALAIAHASDPLSYHGGSVLAMAGKKSVALVLDKRLGQGNALVGDEACRVLECGPRAVLALRGLQGDVQTLLEDVDAKLRLRRLEEGPSAESEPKAVSALVSVMLYGGRLSGGAPSTYSARLSSSSEESGDGSGSQTSFTRSRATTGSSARSGSWPSPSGASSSLRAVGAYIGSSGSSLV